jgi:(2Fe-2S) ferredoxin
MAKVTIFVCTNVRYGEGHASCGARGGERLLQQLRTATEGHDIDVEACCCFGHCEEGAVVKVAPFGKFYHHVTEHDIPELVSDAILLKSSKKMTDTLPD